MEELKAIELSLFLDIRDEYDDIKNGKLFLLYDDRNKTMRKKSLCKVRITDMRGVSFYVPGDPRINTRILLCNGDYHITEHVDWEEGKDSYYFDLGQYLRRRKLQFEVCMITQHRTYVKTQKCFERKLFLEAKGFYYKDKSGFWSFNYVPGMVRYANKRVLELIIQVFDDKFLESDTFIQCASGCKKVIRLDKDNMLKKILENNRVNQVQILTEDMLVRLYKEPIGMVTVDVPPGLGRSKVMCLREKNGKCLDIVDEILKFEKEEDARVWKY